MINSYCCWIGIFMANINRGNTKHSSPLQVRQVKCNSIIRSKSSSQLNTRTNHATEGLDNVERQLQSIVELILPANQAKSNLWRLVMNGKSNNSFTASVFCYYKIYNDLHLIINSGPNDDLVGYIVKLDRLNDAIIYFKRTAVIDEQKRLTQLYDVGRQKLIEASDEVIMRHTNPILPNELLELCRSTSSLSIDTDSMQVPDLGSFRIIFDWFNEHGFQQGLINSYASKRGTLSRNSLKSLAEHLQRNCARRASVSMTCIRSHTSSRRASYCSELLRGKIKTKIDGIGRRLTLSPLLDGRRPSLKNTLLPPEMDTYNDHNVDNLSSSVRFSSDRETNNYKFLLDAFVVLLLHDSDLLFYTFSNEFNSLIFIKSIELPLAYMHDEAQQLCKAIERLPSKIDSGKVAFFGLLSIIRWFHKSKPVFTKFYDENDLAPEHQFGSALSAVFEHSIIECLRMILEEVRNDSSDINQGSHIHPLALHVLSFMEGLLDYEDVITIIGSSRIEEKQNQCLLNLKNYFTDLIQTLRANITTKIQTFIPRNEGPIRAIFILNNVNYLLKRLQSYTPFIMAMREMLNYDNMNHLSGSQLSESDRNQLKTSFSAVNTAIDTLRQQNQEYIIDDIQIRDHLRSESKKLVLDMFKTYYTKFTQNNFFSKSEKYLRYNPLTLESVIDGFFEH
ncbi:unnamed protein product [Rotaria sordida]|uniref:Exocyst complex component 7 n=1 Tax=Rotaria sordida TaxID=392033 RepID=A0A814ZTE0_9BILA|nr:unnamed protein product [Rotaria sordida]